MKRYFAVVISVLCITAISGCGASENNGFLKTTGLDYESSLDESSIENGLNVYHYSYYDVLSEGNYVTAPEFKLKKEYINPEETAIIVIDPWSDMPFPELNKMIENHVDNYILPVVNLAMTNNMPVYIFTNNPDTIDYNTKICESLDVLVDNQSVSVLYYDSTGGGGRRPSVKY